MAKTFAISFLLIISLLLVGCSSSSDSNEMRVSTPAKVYDSKIPSRFHFKTISKVMPVGDLGIGRVVYQEIQNGDIFTASALVIPFREIPVGTEIKILVIEYIQDSYRPSFVHVVK